MLRMLKEIFLIVVVALAFSESSILIKHDDIFLGIIFFLIGDIGMDLYAQIRKY